MVQGQRYLRNLYWDLYAQLQTDGTITATDLGQTAQQKFDFKQQGEHHTISGTDTKGNKPVSFVLNADAGNTVKCQVDKTFYWSLKPVDSGTNGNKIYSIFYADNAWELDKVDGDYLVQTQRYDDKSTRQQWEFIEV